jgi:hypothetical protein
MAAGMHVDELARVALSFPTYAGILSRAAVKAAHQLNLTLGWQAHQAESFSGEWSGKAAPIGHV